jgi:RNA polymerase sigma factor (sigma-70 family)
MTAFTGLRVVADRLSPATAPDGELLARFLEHRDEAAFTVLVRRYGAMVLGTCRRVLGNAADADDAFQAAFVVLVRKAHGLTGCTTVGNYLYGIAFRTALKAKTMAARRRLHEARVRPQQPHTDQSELLSVLDEELARMPEKYRTPVVLCELEGRSRCAAAEALGIAEGTISSRLATAHRMLAKRLRARGFDGVALATVLGAPGVALADSVTTGVVRAVAEPSPAVSQLASEVMKMLLLQKLGIGIAAFAVVVAVAAIATGAMGPRAPAAQPQKPVPAVVASVPVAAPVPAVPEPAWKGEFRKAYGLKDGELVRRIAPPFPECRAEYFKERTRETYKRSKMDKLEEELKRDYTEHFTKLGWKDGWTVDAMTMHYVPTKPDEGAALARVLHATTGLQQTRLDGDAGVLETKVTGDWVVRAGADPEKLVAALEKVLRTECDLKVSLALKDAEREVYVLSGKYTSRPLPDRKENEIEVYAKELTARDEGSCGTARLLEMADCIEGWIEVPIVLGKIEGAPKRVSWHFNTRYPTTKEQHAEEKDPKAVMANVAAQSGLTVKLEKRTIKVLVVKKDS